MPEILDRDQLAERLQVHPDQITKMTREGRIPCDVAIFADTGEEPAAVYRHLSELVALSGPPIWVRSAGKLGDDLIRGRNSTGQRFASIPAFTKDAAGKVGMVRRQCTKEYKLRWWTGPSVGNYSG